MKNYYSIPEAAALLDLTPSGVRHLIRIGQLPVEELTPRARVIPAAAVRKHPGRQRARKTFSEIIPAK